MGTAFSYDESLAKKQERIAATEDMKAQRKVILASAALTPGEYVIDIGCGNGILARDFLSQVGEAGKVYGLDCAPAMIALAEHLCEQGTFVLGSVTDVPFKADYFDVVTSSQLYCFLNDVDCALEESWRILKPGGRLVILDTDWDSLIWNSTDPILFESLKAYMLERYVDAHVPRTLSKRLEKAGFVVKARTSMPVVNWQFESDTFSQQLLNLIEPKSDHPDPGNRILWQKWKSDLETVTENGEYMFSVNRYIFVAEKPNN